MMILNIFKISVLTSANCFKRMEFSKPNILSLDKNIADNFKSITMEVLVYFSATESGNKTWKNMLRTEALKLYVMKPVVMKVQKQVYLFPVFWKMFCNTFYHSEMKSWKSLTSSQENSNHMSLLKVSMQT